MNDETRTMSGTANTAGTAAGTATALLRERHNEVRGMLDQLMQTQGQERSDLFDCLRATLAVHETVEEIVIHPRVRKFGGDAERAVQARLEEETQAKSVLNELEKTGTDDPSFPARLTAFRSAVLAHAAAEEREIFPRIESGCTAEEQMQMAERIRTAEKMAPTHPHPHAPSTKMGNLLAGPFATMIDKVRDALTK